MLKTATQFKHHNMGTYLDELNKVVDINSNMNAENAIACSMKMNQPPHA